MENNSGWGEFQGYLRGVVFLLSPVIASAFHQSQGKRCVVMGNCWQRNEMRNQAAVATDAQHTIVVAVISLACSNFFAVAAILAAGFVESSELCQSPDCIASMHRAIGIKCWPFRAVFRHQRCSARD
jgi:hypothetical protein